MNDTETDIDVVLDYHQQTKHHPSRYARALGYMDWENQPNPFRHFQNTSTIALEHGVDSDGPLYRELFSGNISPKKVNHLSISQLFYYSMALSAWKQVPGGAAWPLRVNPSSGNLHPTESYLVIGPQALPQIEAGLYHYRPDCHALEQRRALSSSLWQVLEQQLPQGGFLIGLTSIYWRETWKYGERGFRYCHHDVGHAIGAISTAVLSLGWNATLVDTMTDEALALLLGCENQEGIEAEHADCLLVIDPHPRTLKTEKRPLHFDQAFLSKIKNIPCLGKENKLSDSHHDWPIIEQVSAASSKKSGADCNTVKQTQKQASVGLFPNGNKPAFEIIRQRRSAVAMDGVSTLEQSQFYGILGRVQCGHLSSPLAALPWTPHLSLFLFVHRVVGLEPGLYVLVRDASHFDLLKKMIKPDFLWEKPSVCPDSLNLFLLAPQDVQQISKSVSCTQDIAADGAFSLGMLARFEPGIKLNGAHFYPRLFWEAGLIGQLLYLEAEAVGLQATGIGCFLDDVMHDLLGIQDRSWQSLYHFTVGGPKEDGRLQTQPAYHHLQEKNS